MPQQAEQQAPALLDQDALRFQVIATVLTALMFASLVYVIGGAIQRFNPVWQPIYMTVLSLLIVAESSFISYVVKRDRLILGENTRYLVAEIAVLFVFTRVVATLSTGALTLQSDLQQWLISPLSILADPAFILCFLIGLLIGFLAQQSVRDLHYLLPQSFEHQAIPRDEHRYVYNMANQDRSQALQRINRRFVYGGLLLLIALMIQVVPNGLDLSQQSLSVSATIGLAALIYIISGFLLYSQSWLSMLQARWALESSKVDKRVLRRWTQISILLVAGLCIVALFVPRNYGMGLLETIHSSFGLLGMIIAQIGYTLLWLGSMLVMLPMILLSWLLPDADAPTPPPPPPMPTPEIVTLTEELPPPLLPSLIFWACMFLLFGYAIWVVIQRHPGLKSWLTLQKPMYWLMSMLGIVWKDTTSWVQYAANTITTRLKQARPKETKQWPSLRLNRLLPRDLVRYFYRSTLQRAAKQGLARQVGQTPYEYTQTLQAHLPDSQNDITILTEAFVQAHYGLGDPDKDEIRKIKRHWENIRRRLTVFK